MVLASGSYSYDVFNNLVAETITVSGVATTSKFAYDGSQIYADLSGTGTVQTLYVTGMSDGRGQLYARIQSGTLYWIVQDRQGSVREIINSSGSSILDAITYTDDGGIQSQTGSTYLGNYGYTGLRYDSLTTYWVAVNRWYNPAIDQWIEEDPDGYAGGLSDLRDYVGNDWTNAVDLSGLDSMDVTIKDGSNKMPAWSFGVKFSVPSNMNKSPDVQVTGQTTSITARALQANGSIQVAKLNAEGTYAAKKDQKFLIYLEEVTTPEKVTGSIKKYLNDWVTLKDRVYYTANVKFKIYEITDEDKKIGLKVIGTKDGIATDVGFTSGVQVAAEGSIQMILSPNDDTCKVRVSIGGANSQTVKSGTGAEAAEGDYYSPKIKDTFSGVVYKDINIPDTPIPRSNPKTDWSMKWTKSDQ